VTPEEQEVLFALQREAMVEEHILGRGVHDPSVLDALRTVRRHRFMLPATRDFAYEDHAMPIGSDQTISQPYVVAVTLAHARIRPGAKVLDVGTGSGYQAALAAELGACVHTVERIPDLLTRATEALAREGYADRVMVHRADGYVGLPDHAPFDAIIVAAAPPTVPPALLDQLAPGGVLVIPVGADAQELEVWTAGPEGPTREVLFAVGYVPLVPGLETS
jgi:protein-L-isoaspartate(D-aspartate) O-methyltransferase